MRSIIRARSMGLFAWCAGLSATVTAIAQIGVLSGSTQSLGLATLFGLLIFIIVQIFELRMDFHVMQKPKEYFIVNFSAYAILAAISMIIRPLLNVIGGIFGHRYAGNVIHTWLFSIYKFAMFSNTDLGWIYSSLIGHVFMLVVIFLAPIGMRRYFLYDQLRR